MTDTAPHRPRARRLALFLTIGVLAASAVFGAILIVVGDQANVAGRAWMTLFLLGAFAGAVALDATVSNGPNRWYLPASTITNALLVAIGLMKLWNGPLQPSDTSETLVWMVQFWRFIAVAALARLALLLTQVYGLRFVTRATTRISSIGGVVTLALVWSTVLVLALPAIFPAPEWPAAWWRLAGATTLVGAVAAVIPLIVRAFEARPAEREGPSADPRLRNYPPYSFPQPGVYAEPAQAAAQPQSPQNPLPSGTPVAPWTTDTSPQGATGFPPPQ